MGITQSRQIIILFLLPALLAVALLALFLRNELEGWAIERWSKNQYEFANLLGEQISDDLKEAANLLQYTAALPEFTQALDQNKIDRSLNGIPPGVDESKRNILNQLSERGNFSVLFLLTPEGDHYLSHPYAVQRALQKFNLSSRSYFKEAQRSKTLVISNSFIGADGVPAVALNLPILDAQGNIIAHLGGVRYLHHLDTMISPEKIAPFDKALLLDGEGNRIASSGAALDTFSAQSFARLNTQMPTGTSIRQLRDSNNLIWLSFQLQLDTGWSLQLMRRMDHLQDEISPQLQKTISLGIGIIILTSIIGAWMALRFSRRWREADAALKQANETLEQRVKQRTEALAYSELRHRTLFESTADAVLLLRKGQIIDCNNSALRMFGASSKDMLLQRVVGEFSTPNQTCGGHSAELAKQRIQQAYDEGSCRFEWMHKRLDNGKVFPAEVLLSRMVVDDDPLLQATVQDISERKSAEERIRTLSQAIEQSPVSVVITDTKGNIEYVNQAFERITGYDEKDVLGQNSRLLKSGNTPPRRYQELWKAILSGKSWQGEFQNKRKNGEIFWEQAHIAPVIDVDGITRHFLAVKQDVTLHKMQEEHILHQALYDNLTELPNRFLSLDRLDQLISDAKRDDSQIAVLFIDLDDFKKVNDTLGHETGDHLLQHAANRLNYSVREQDTVGRLGGDEFIVLLGGLKKPEDALPVAEKILNCFRDPFKIANRELVVTASMGISIYPDNGISPAELLRNADTAMYASKGQGGNTCHFFTEEMNMGVSRRLALEEQLHGALGNNEFEVVYQPLVDINSRSIIGAEALLRWYNPTLGNIPPDEFIPVAEQTGLIIPIGQYVLSQALEMTAKWSKQRRWPFKIAVNLSPRQFRDENLATFIQEKLHETGVSGRTLELEITEGVLMGDHGYINSALETLCRMEIGIAMDDFGTGYSSLSYLRSYPFDTLKIDRSFINDINVDAADRELVSAAIAMAHGLGLKVVAEGVETEEQMEYLATQYCDIAQGYLFSKPVKAGQISQMLREGGFSQSGPRR
ncbi:EAL domain-containing protein [Pontibacterium sp.]|uniref:EAL domain-containing protein n=1 Tax=Pontibacterium sp. TaxID=2036026 RepID=UPI0035197C95